MSQEEQQTGEKHYVTMRHGNLIGHDIYRMMVGDYYYTVCTSRFLVGLRRRFFPRTVHYEERYQPPIPPLGQGLTFPLWEAIPRVPSPSVSIPPDFWKNIITKADGGRNE